MIKRVMTEDRKGLSGQSLDSAMAEIGSIELRGKSGAEKSHSSARPLKSNGYLGSRPGSPLIERKLRPDMSQRPKRSRVRRNIAKSQIGVGGWDEYGHRRSENGKTKKKTRETMDSDKKQNDIILTHSAILIRKSKKKEGNVNA